MLQIFTSSVADGSMKSTNMDFRSVLPARQTFLQNHDVAAKDTTLVQLVYQGEDYCRYSTIAETDKGDGITRDATIVADALVTTDKHHALFLPLADCIGAVIHDPTNDILMLSHLGRHNLEQFGGAKSINYLVQQFDCDPNSLTVWLSPAAGGENYPLFSFENRSMHAVAAEQLIGAGIDARLITTSQIDVTTERNYFSHSEFLKGNQMTDGRFAVVTMMS